MEAKKINRSTLSYLFRKSSSYKVWRLYCRIRDNTVSLVKEGKIYQRRYFAQEMNQLVTNSKTFAYWAKLFYFRHAVSLQLHIAIIQPILKAGKTFVPKKLKLYLKKHFFIYLLKPSAQFSLEIMREWKNWINIRNDKSADIFIFGITSWDYRFQRPQHLAEELSKKGHRIFYIETEFVSGSSKIHAQKVQENIYKIKLFSSKNYFIYNDHPTKQDVGRMFESLKIIFQESRALNIIAKVDHPFWGSIASKLDVPVIYDCMDEHGGFSESGKITTELEKEILNNASLVLTTSDKLMEKIKRSPAKNILMIKNAGEFIHFYKAAAITKNTIPRDMENLQGPILGYYGAVADWLDSKIIEKLAISYPQASIVIIGRVQSDVIAKLAEKHSNIHLLGEKPYGELPSYLQLFDVCLIPFKINKLIKATNPVKIYEYFASGKPVVCTDIPELAEYRKLLYIASGKEDFVKAVRVALKEKSSGLVRARQNIAKDNTWEKRADLLNKEIEKIVFAKVSVILVVYNNPDFTKISIDSILARSKYDNYELIIVDNNSNSETIKVLKTYTNNKRIKLIFNKTNLGFAGGNNTGLRVAKGEYLILINNDVRVTPGWISRLINHVNKPNVGIVGPVTNNIGNEAKIDIIYNPENILKLEKEATSYTYSHWNQTTELNKLAAFCWIKTRQTFNEIGYLDDRFGRGLFEDDDYCMRVKKAGKKIMLVEDVFIHHYGGKTTKWNTPEYQKLFNVNKKIFEDKWGVNWEPNKYRKGIR